MYSICMHVVSVCAVCSEPIHSRSRCCHSGQNCIHSAIYGFSLHVPQTRFSTMVCMLTPLLSLPNILLACSCCFLFSTLRIWKQSPSVLRAIWPFPSLKGNGKWGGDLTNWIDAAPELKSIVASHPYFCKENNGQSCLSQFYSSFINSCKNV